MSNKVVCRKIDELGRVVIPYEIRHELKLINQQEVNIYTENGKIIIENKTHE